MVEVETLILGGGLAGLSASYHIGHDQCLIVEAKNHVFGHISSREVDGFTWDEGPHVSFTKHEYVRELFADSVKDNYEEYPVTTGNYYQGHWIDHPAQSNLYQVPEPLRTECLKSFLNSREGEDSMAVDYEQWLRQAFGPTFAENFPSVYTRKYWTVEPSQMTTDWVGGRVFKPSVDDVVEGSRGPLARQTHYIKKIRYPCSGGYQSFARSLAENANVRLNETVAQVDLESRELTTQAGTKFRYKRLINTIPLPIFIDCCSQVPASVVAASESLLCSQVLLVNVTAPHPTLRPENWIYVYDESKYATRINCTEKLSPNNAPAGHTGVQVEVYHSREKPLAASEKDVADVVVEELIEMGLIDPEKAGGFEQIKTHTQSIRWANVIYTHVTKEALDQIWNWLATKGLCREPDDLEPLTNWDNQKECNLGKLLMAGRFAQWKYYWTDDCVLRGASLSHSQTNHLELAPLPWL